MSPLGFGTDIGGSIRTPCHFSGICGIKPTLDRFAMRGYRSVLAGQEVVRGQGGPMARAVSDLALFFRAIDAREMGALDPRVPPIAWEEPAGVRLDGLRVGVCTDDGLIPASRSIVRAVKRAGDALVARGCTITAFTPPGISAAIEQYLAALSADGGRTIAAALANGEIDPVLKQLKQITALPSGVRRGLARAAELAGEHGVALTLRALGEKRVADLWKLTDALRGYRAKLIEAMDADKLDLVIAPAFATPALMHGGSKGFTLASSYAMIWNLVQFPAGVVPVTRVRADEADRDAPKGSLEKKARAVDRASAGLPVGVQAIARPWAESLVLGAMAAIEEEAQKDSEYPRTPVTPS
jgi:fatty acid amide hydrolase